MKKSTIPGTRIIKVGAERSTDEKKINEDLKKIGKIAYLNKYLKQK